MESFRAFRAHKEGGKVTGSVERLSLADLSSGEVVIRSVYSSVNYKDALGATGSGKILSRFPVVPGIDVAGYVESSTDAQFQRGMPVLVTGFDFGVGHDGGYSEYVRVPSEWVVALPDSLSLFDAMALGTAGFTVALCVQRFQDNHQTPERGAIVVTGATGGVGSIAVNVLAHLGYDVVALTGKREANAYLNGLGAKHILYRDEVHYGERPLERVQWAGAIDNVGGDALTWLTRTVGPWGNICSVGLAGGSQLNGTVMPFLLRGVSILGVSSSGCPAQWRPGLWAKLAHEWRPPALAKLVTRTVTLTDLPEVFQTMLKGQIIGRTVVHIADA